MNKQKTIEKILRKIEKVYPKCPECGNLLQNAIPVGSPNHRRCASCKTVWEVGKCQRCCCQLQNGYCRDVTCPFSDHLQSCNTGWSGHPKYDPHPEDDTAVIACTCQKST